METQLIKYIRNADYSPRGVAVAIRNGQEVSYGYSLHNPIDKWDKKLGIKKAIARANAEYGYSLPQVDERHEAVVKAFKDLEKRALRYFKDIDSNDVKLGFDEAGNINEN